jgi:hypothetical protein
MSHPQPPPPRVLKSPSIVYRSIHSANSERDSIMPWTVKSSFKNRLTDISLEINRIDSHISVDKNCFSPFKPEISAFWIWTLYASGRYLTSQTDDTSSLPVLLDSSPTDHRLLLEMTLFESSVLQIEDSQAKLNLPYLIMHVVASSISKITFYLKIFCVCVNKKARNII